MALLAVCCMRHAQGMAGILAAVGAALVAAIATVVNAWLNADPYRRLHKAAEIRNELPADSEMQREWDQHVARLVALTADAQANFNRWDNVSESLGVVGFEGHRRVVRM